MRIAHNLTAMNSQRQLNINTKSRAKSVEKLSSGFRINRSADDAAGLAISEKMRRQIRGLTQASKNVQDGISFCQVADGALHEVDDMLHRINELSIKAANGTNTDEDREYMDAEVQQIKDELTRIFETTEFNGIKIFKVPYTSSIKSNANDFVTYNKDASGTSGGMIINGERLTWRELGFKDGDLYQDGVGNYRFKEDTTIKRELTGGEILELRGLKDQPLESASRVYRWSADSSGITINNNTAERISWSSVKNTATNTAINPSHVEQGTYQFNYHGMTISFETEASDKTLDSVISAINGGGATKTTSWYTTQSSAKAVSTLRVTNPSYPGNVTIELYDTMPSGILDTGLRLYANNDGIGVRSDNHPYTDYTFTTWEDLGIKDWGISDSATGSAPGAGKTYTYSESEIIKGMKYSFTIADGASKESVINAINNTSLVRTYSYMCSNQSQNTTLSDGTWIQPDSGSFKMDFHNLLKPVTGGSREYTVDVKFDAVNDGDNNSDYKVYVSISADGGQTAKYEGSFTRADSTPSGAKKSIVYVNTNITNAAELLTGVSAKEQAEGVKGLGSETSQRIGIELTDEHWGNDYTASFTFNYSQPRGYIAYASSGVTTSNPIYSQIVDPPTKVLDIQAGSENELSNRIEMEWSPLNLGIIGMEGTTVATQGSAISAIEATKGAMQIVNKDRMLFGAYQNRFEHTVNSLENVIENTTAAESAIRDTDMAKASVELAKHNILLQVGQSMLAQANQLRENIISLLS